MNFPLVSASVRVNFKRIVLYESPSRIRKAIINNRL